MKNTQRNAVVGESTVLALTTDQYPDDAETQVSFYISQFYHRGEEMLLSILVSLWL